MQEQSTGLMGSIKRLASSVLAILATRLELLANELEEEGLRLIQMLCFGIFALFCFSMALLLLAVLMVVLFWNDHRLEVLALSSGVFVLLGVVATLLLRGKIKSGSTLFSVSLAELAKDNQALRGTRE